MSAPAPAGPARTADVAATTVAERIVERLAELGIGTLFGVHGANAEDVFDAAVRRPGITPVIAKHEFGAGAMADGLARISGGPAAVLTTSGGGALNVVPALGESYDSRVPVLAVIGSAPRPTVGHGGFQDMLDAPDTVDLPAVLSGVTGCCRVVDDPAALDEAFDDAVSALRRGLPAALIVPKDVQGSGWSRGPDRAEPLSETSVPPRRSSVPPRRSSEVETAPETTPDLAPVLERLRRAAATGERVCFWAGEEASRAGVRDVLGALATRLGADTVVSPGGRDAGTADCAGVTGVMGHPSAHAALAEADVVVALGCRMSLTDRAGLDQALAAADVVHLGAHRPRLPGVDHVETPDLPHVVASLRDALADHPPAAGRTPRAREYLTTPGTAGPLTMRQVIETVGAALPAGCTVFADAGNAGAAAIHHLPFGAGRFTVALGMGGMGYGIAAGVGAAVGLPTDAPAARTVVIAGDGSFLMHGMEIHTAVEHRAPLTLIVLNNNAHGMCVTRERIYFPGTPGLNRFGDTDIAAGLAAMFPGLDVRRAVGPEDLHTACAELMSRPGPGCLVVDVDPDEIPPFGPFLKGTP
ncbi:MAG: thiamine pyrophosphate-binding protein [Gordonia sp. (in: high G+C Gram-positive bacteria)]|uniref:thiamine pyrophosphate-binding protein n=1 Tax=Gordonia sp. (in: high G+C Gram-positive bacteria) TaxID=84139 RepID=UPI0039E5E199